MPSIYLDWAATGLPMDEVLAECTKIAGDHYANPSSQHAPGKAARKLLEEARQGCAQILGCKNNEVYFTSGGSEANNIICTSLVHKRRTGSVVIAAIEHASVYEPVQHLKDFGFDVRVVRPMSNGITDPSSVAANIDDSTQCVSIMHVNNETGAIQPVEEIGVMLKKAEVDSGRKIHFHCDAVQSFGKLPLNVKQMGIDSLTVSGHKLGAPKGGGLLYLQKEVPILYRGGGQESEIRPGTENLPSIWGLYRSASMWAKSRQSLLSHAQQLYEFLSEQILNIDGAVLNGRNQKDRSHNHSPYILSVAFPPIPGEVLVRVMSDHGYYISTGSACSSRGKKNTRVLMNMGIEKHVADSTIRISTGPSTSLKDCESFCNALSTEIAALKRSIAGY